MADKQDIITAIKNKGIFVKVPEMKNADFIPGMNGLPYVIAGGFNMVFKYTLNSEKWAFRVWHVKLGENQKRFQTISKYLIQKQLPYFADFIYDKKGILVNGEYIDTIRMKWLEGDLLKEYIDKNISRKKVLEKLGEDFLQMCNVLKENDISHGDLQEGNILVDPKGNIQLIDYDSVCIQEIEGQKELVTGLRGYQHPSRFNSKKSSLKSDYFSELIIYLSLLAFSEKDDLWKKYKIKESQTLLFTHEDFRNFNNSEIKKDLLRLSSRIIDLVRVLEDYINVKSFLDIIPFYDDISELNSKIKQEPCIDLLIGVNRSSNKTKNNVITPLPSSLDKKNREGGQSKQIVIGVLIIVLFLFLFLYLIMGFFR